MKKLLYVFTSCKRSGPIQIMYNLVSNINFKEYQVHLITLYNEDKNDSRLDDFIKLGVKHHLFLTSKKDILLGKTKALKQYINELKPICIHSMGVFPDYCISKMGFDCQFITLHNYMHEDYLLKFGRIKGRFLERLQWQAVKRAAIVVTCSKSLSDIYFQKKKIRFDYIRNGVNLDSFYPLEKDESKFNLRKKLSLPNKKIYITVGQLIERKNPLFLASNLLDYLKQNDSVLLFVGDGPLRHDLESCSLNDRLLYFAGNVTNVREYLLASDYYISASKSEGMPTSVLEAMGCGLPVILSNIPQHNEILEFGNCGKAFVLDNKEDMINTIAEVTDENYDLLKNKSLEIANDEFNSAKMSKKYVDMYETLARK